jgi:hypothetical protein
MGGKQIETDEQQKNNPDQPKVILKPLLKGIHGSSLAHFEVVGLIVEGNLPGLSRRAIHRIPINRPTDWARFRCGRAFTGPNPAKHPLTIVSEGAARPQSLIASAGLSINIRRLSLGNQILALVEQLSSAMIGMHSLAATAC